LANIGGRGQPAREDAMANETKTMALDSPEMAKAARAAGYKSKRLGPALYALELLHRAGGDEATAEAMLSESMKAAAPRAEGR
jgi:hypothetical protein